MNTRYTTTWGVAADPDHRWRPNRILALREHAGLTKSQLARELGCPSESIVGKWDFSRPGPEYCKKLDAYAAKVRFTG